MAHGHSGRPDVRNVTILLTTVGGDLINGIAIRRGSALNRHAPRAILIIGVRLFREQWPSVGFYCGYAGVVRMTDPLHIYRTPPHPAARSTSLMRKECGRLRGLFRTSGHRVDLRVLHVLSGLPHAWNVGWKTTEFERLMLIGNGWNRRVPTPLDVDCLTQFIHDTAASETFAATFPRQQASQ